MFSLFSLSLFELLHLQSNKTHIKTEATEKASRKTLTTTENANKSLSPSRNLRDIYSRSGRGLDILYFCCCLMFFFELLCFVFCLFFFLKKKYVRSVFLSFCIYNRKQTYNNRTTNRKSFDKTHNNINHINKENIK